MLGLELVHTLIQMKSAFWGVSECSILMNYLSPLGKICEPLLQVLGRGASNLLGLPFPS